MYTCIHVHGSCFKQIQKKNIYIYIYMWILNNILIQENNGK